MVIHLSALALALCASAMATPAFAAQPPIIRTDSVIKLRTGEHLFVREVRRSRLPAKAASAVLLIHGARVPGIASFDLPVPGGSLAADLAADGHIVYVIDIRGYGASSRPAAMERPAAESAPLMRTDEVVADIAAVVDAIAGWNGDVPVSLIGWATGGHWAGAYASRYPQKVARIVLYNTLYGGTGEHPMLGRGSSFEDPDRPGSFNAAVYGGYRVNTRASLFPAWDDSIPDEDKTAWRDPAVAAAYGDAAIASDQTAQTREPPSFRAPSGALADSFELALDRRQWPAAALAMPALVIRSGGDFWSRPEDARTIVREAPRATLLEIPEATHFVHLDRDVAGRGIFLAAVRVFLGQSGE